MIVTAISEFFNSLSRSARAGLVLGALVVIALAAATLWWVFTPDYRLLFGNLREADAAEITQSLTEWKIPYRFSDDGKSITIPAEQVYDTRMKLVSAGVPSGGHVGFELFNDADFGATEFAQRINYQRALQGEIERTIASIPGVETARVHLTIRRPGLFVGAQDSSKASVALTLSPGTQLTAHQVGGVRNLVASAVEGLAPDAVVVLGPSGVLLGGAGNSIGTMAQDEEQGQYESRVRDRITDLVGQVFHLTEFKVTVDARLNFDQVRQVKEHLIAQGQDGNGLLVRKQTHRSGAGKAPNVDPANAPAEGGAMQAQEDIEYAHGTEREEISRAPGRVERLSVAVLVPPTLTPAQLERLKTLVSAAAGIDAERGDRLEIGALGGLDSQAQRIAGNPVLNPGMEIDASTQAAPAGPAIDRIGASVRWLLAGVALIGLLLGLALSQLHRSRPASLTPEEREAVLARMRSWLADGTSTP